MATINYDFCEEKDLYNSGDIEEEMLKIYKSGKSPVEDRFFYSVTPVRENITNWYPFKKGSNILEVGGGLGATTKSLCKVAKKVTSCEYSKRRAENIYYRHKNEKNLEVIVGNLNKITFKEKFDYIVLIGVFEYAKRFSQAENPFVGFLKNLKKNLKDDGVILLAIENRYGIKYWAGATEDHYGEKYLGLYGYDNYDIQTLGKDELVNIINESGFKNYKFYYPYPDYKMPYIIHTDQRLPLMTELPSFHFYNHGEQIYNFDYRKVLPGIIENNKYDFFANSFLVELSNNKQSISNIVFAKTNWYREKNYQIYTIITDDNKIVKIPKYPEAEKHLDNMILTNDKLKELGSNVSNIKKINNEYNIDYIPGQTLYEYIYYLTKKKDKKAINKELDNYYKLLKSISSKGKIKKFVNLLEEEYFNNSEIFILKVNLFDLQMSNIIKNKDKYYIIDQEWVSNYDIPLNYMMYYSLYYLFEWVNNFDALFNIDDLNKKYGISPEEIKIYNSMSEYFSNDEFRNVDKKSFNMFMSKNNLKLIDNEYNKIVEENKKGNNNYKLQLENISNKYNILLNDYNNMIKSKRWKFINKTFSFMDKINKKVK